MRNALLSTAAVLLSLPACSWAKSGVIVDDLPQYGSVTLIPISGPVIRLVADPSVPVQSQLPAAFVSRTISAPAAQAASAAQAQIRTIAADVSAARQSNQSPKETLDQAFERSVARATGATSPSVVQADEANAASAKAPSVRLDEAQPRQSPSAPQPPAPKDPRTFWQKHGNTLKGASLGTLVLAASTFILGAKSLEIPAFVGLLTGLLPYLRSVHADGKAGDFLPTYVQSIIGGGLGLFFGWGMSHFGYSSVMAGYGLMAGIFTPQFLTSVRKPTTDVLPLGQMIGSALAGMVVGGTLPLWLGAKLGRKLTDRKNAAR